MKKKPAIKTMVIILKNNRLIRLKSDFIGTNAFTKLYPGNINIIKM